MYISCHYYGPAKLTYGLKSGKQCDSSKNMVTFFKKYNQKVGVCTTAFNAEGSELHITYPDRIT
jgi:hypothetical protein